MAVIAASNQTLAANAAGAIFTTTGSYFLADVVAGSCTLWGQEASASDWCQVFPTFNGREQGELVGGRSYRIDTLSGRKWQFRAGPAGCTVRADQP